MTGYASTAVLTLALLLGPSAQGADAPADLAPALRSCTGCHGAKGVSTNPVMPTIAGISAGVHADALYAYREGERPCETAKAMCGIAKRLSDEKIEAIAQFYAALPFVSATQATDAEKAARGGQIHQKGCEKCHSESGGNAADDASVLAGQWMHYLRENLRHLRDGTRAQPAAMKSKMESLSDEDIEALVHFYGSVK